MFQCIIQPKNGFSFMNRQEMKEVFPDLRLQLTEQLKCLDNRVETQVTLANELQDFFRKRAEVEMESSKALDKLAKSLSLRHKEVKQKRDQMTLFSVSNCWQELITETKKQSKEHSLLAEIYSTHITQRFAQSADDIQRVYKNCREIGMEAHEELLKVLHELHTSTKTFNSYQTEYRQTESKMKIVEAQKAKLMEAIPKEKWERSKKIRLVDKEVEKRRKKYTDAKFKALKSKNEYILCMDAANACLQKYFVDDLSDLIDCMDLGFYQCISRALSMYVSTQEQMKRSYQENIENLSKFMVSMDARLDKQRFLEANNSCFIMPKKFEFQPPILGKSEEVDLSEPAELEANGFIRQELEQRLIQLHRRLETLRTEFDELWKTLETAENSLLGMLTASDWDTTPYFEDVNKPIGKPSEQALVKMRTDRHETDEFHLAKFRDYMLGTNRIFRLQAKYDHIRKILGETDGGSSPALALTGSTASQPRKQRRKRIGQLQNMGIPRLFGGSLEDYLDATNTEIPLVIKSCIRVINLFGLQHHGIFRVSGSQVEINNFKEAFERGEDPLADMTDASDINSVGGVLKLYLRELREPLFPLVFFDQFMELSQLESKQQFVIRMKELMKSLPRPVFVVLRYLFAFLNHLSEYSDENMMDMYNLAICFGPTLVPVPEDKDQVQYQNLVNELIKNVIIYAEDIFPSDDGGILYEKYISKDPDEGDVGEAPHDQSEEMDSEICPSEDDSVFIKDRDMSIFGKSEYLEAIAQFDFMARSPREVSFRKGETVTLYSQVSSDWWKGSANGIDGLIPDKYILIKIRDEDRSHREETPKGPHLTPNTNSRMRTASDSFLSAPKALSLDSSHSEHPQQHRGQRYLQVKMPKGSPGSNNSFLAVSGESLASSTSPESPSEFGSLEREPHWGVHHSKVVSGQHSLPLNRGSGHQQRVMAPPENCTRAHQRSQSVSNEVQLAQPVWREALMEEDQNLEPKSLPDSFGDDLSVSPPPPAPSSASPQFHLLSEETAPLPIPEDDEAQFLEDTGEAILISERSGSEGDERGISLSFSTPKTVENEDVPEPQPQDSPPTTIHEPKAKGSPKSSTPLVTIKSYTELSSQGKYSLPSKSQSKSEDFGKKVNLKSNIQLWEMRSRSNHTPDLVMDLPVGSSLGGGEVGTSLEKGEKSDSSGGKSPASSTSSSGSPVTTPDSSPDSNIAMAECFAKQNQCTLKKNQTPTTGGVGTGVKNGESGKKGFQDDYHHYQNTRELFGRHSPLLEQEEPQGNKSPQYFRSQSQPHNPQSTFNPPLTESKAKSQDKINHFEREGRPAVFSKPQVLRKPILPQQLGGSQGGAKAGENFALAGIKKGNSSSSTYIYEP